MKTINKESIAKFKKECKQLKDLGYSHIGFDCQGKPRKSDIERNNKAMIKFNELKGN